MTRVLIVDDDDFILDIYVKKFSTQGCEVVAVHSGQEALEMLRKGEMFDAVMFDILMPAYTGLEMLADIKKERLCSSAAYVVLSNQGHQKDVDDANQIGVDGYIVKASTVPSEVFAQVIEIIEKKKSGNVEML
jgi:CheY-like chemotaxis protein